jgi:DNA mismatch repair ATPase MutS
VDYSKELERLFQRFQQGEDESLDLETLDIGSVSWVEGEILERVGLVHKEVFFRLRSYVELHTWFQNPTIILFDEEIQFFTAYLSVITPLRDAGLSFCFPSILESKKHVEARDAFDLPLALQLLLGKERPVPNDFQLEGQERVLVVTGPNQGGKTTFARMFGQLHYLGSLGCPVPGSSAHLLLPDRIFTHFEREESTSSEGGKLEDDVIRIHAILQDATEKSIFIVNEIFASTSLSDAVFLSREIVERITRLDALCVWVTFLEEIASLSPATIGYVSSVDPQDPVVRTFRILRKSSDGQTYAAALANRHRLSYEAILARMAS